MRTNGLVLTYPTLNTNAPTLHKSHRPQTVHCFIPNLNTAAPLCTNPTDQSVDCYSGRNSELALRFIRLSLLGDETEGIGCTVATKPKTRSSDFRRPEETQGRDFDRSLSAARNSAAVVGAWLSRPHRRSSQAKGRQRLSESTSRAPRLPSASVATCVSLPHPCTDNAIGCSREL